MLVAITVGIWLGIDPLLRWSLLQSGQRIAGAKVDIGSLRTDLLHGSMQIDQLRVAAVTTNSRISLELERAFLDVDMYAALRRKLVIRDGHLDGLRFDTTRDDSGRLATVPDVDEGDSFSVTSSLARWANVRKRG